MLMTASPCADAERWANDQDIKGAQAEALEIEAYGIVLAALCSKQGSWFKPHDMGDALITPDDELAEAVGNDDEVTDTFDALMTATCPEALAFQEALASFIAKKHWRDIAGWPDAV